MRSAVLVALMVVAAACARPTSTAQQPTPTPSPSPTPTAPLMATSAPFHGGEVGVAYAPVAMSATGGVQPYRWTVSQGSLPGGLSIGSDGSLSGNPTSAGTFTFTIQAADAGDGTAGIPGTIVIAAALSAALTPACASTCAVELGCVNVCGAFGLLTGGVGPFGYALASGTLPAGTTLSGLSLTGKFVGLSGYLKFTVQVTDALGATTSVAPTFWMYDHIALASGSCIGNYPTGCTVQLKMTGGVPGGAPSVRITNIGPYCNANGCVPASGSPPPGYGLTASGGVVTVSIPKQILAGYRATWTLVLTDHSLCGPGTECSSAPATVSINVVGG